MHILHLGATGRTGQPTLNLLLRNNHQITALVRNPSALEPHPNLTILPGSPLNQADLQTVINTSPTPIDAVVITLANTRTSDSPFSPPNSPPNLIVTTLLNTINAFQNAHAETVPLPKFIILSALGSGSSAPYTNPLLRILFRTSNMRWGYADHDAVEQELVRDRPRVPKLNFVLVRPTRLSDGENGGGDRIARVWDGKQMGRVGITAGIERAAVARFLLDCVEGNTWDGTMPIIIG